MNSQDFLTLNLVGAAAFLFWYLLSRGGSHRPTQLNMKAEDSAPPLLEPLPVEVRDVSEVKTEMPVLHPDLQVRPRPKVLNVMFNYNGHSWDAYEVLGVPAGASIHIVTEAYQTAIRKCDKESIEFMETAYKAILNRMS